MELRFDAGIADEYVVRTDRFGHSRYPLSMYERMAYDWVARELPCSQCGQHTLVQRQTSPVGEPELTNLVCETCESTYRLECSARSLRASVQFGSWRVLMDALREGNCPSWLCITYDRMSFSVTDAFLVPGSALQPECISTSTFGAQTLEEGGDTWCEVGFGLLRGVAGPEAVTDIVRDGVAMLPSQAH